MDKLECQQLFINQYLNLTLQKYLNNKGTREIVRMPLEIYRYCKSIFKREGEIAHLLLELYRRDFYIKKMSNLQKELESRPDNIYFQILAGASSVDFV